MMNDLDILETYTNIIKEQTSLVPDIAIILGSGLNSFIKMVNIDAEISYSSLPDFPICTNKMHKGRFIIGTIENKNVIIADGRLHYYEGYTPKQVIMPVRIMKLLGAKTLVITNAAGGINENFEPGDFMVIKDQISSFVPSPLRGYNIDELGPRFPDCSNIYDTDLRNLLKECAANLNIPITEGVYLQTQGPNYETPAEIKMYKLLGADAVGMSTSMEAICGSHCGLKICGLSCITNKAAGLSDNKLSDHEVIEIASKSANDFCRLLFDFIKKLD